MRCEARLTELEIEPAALLRDFIDAAGGAGAVVSFCGLARDGATDGRSVSTLHLEHHPRLTELSLQQIARDGAARFDLANTLVVHRWGAIQPTETIVFVAAAARHRGAAFLGADYLMDRLKTEAVLWKKEEGIDGTQWIEPSDADRAAVARWND
jgi:molybdopterin synthase catalytic subunit